MEFQNAGLDTGELVLFHGTTPANTHNICTGNFELDVSNRFMFGRGIYFSKCPNTALQYGQDLIMCRVIIGRKHKDSRKNKPLLQQVCLHHFIKFHNQCNCIFSFSFRVTTALKLTGCATMTLGPMYLSFAHQTKFSPIVSSEPSTLEAR